MSCRGLIAAVATVAAILSGDAGAGLASPQSRQEPDLAAYDLGIAAAVRSDLAASVQLPDGGQVYVFGDTLAVNGQVICGPSRCPDGYPHDSIAIQRPGTATFGMQSCAAAGCPYGWQWVPNWPDGSYFWMAAPAVEGTSLYVIGERISRRPARSRVSTRPDSRSAPATPSPTRASPRSPVRRATPSGGQPRLTQAAAGGG